MVGNVFEGFSPCEEARVWFNLAKALREAIVEMMSKKDMDIYWSLHWAPYIIYRSWLHVVHE
jgi:hypothetical protein